MLCDRCGENPTAGPSGNENLCVECLTEASVEVDDPEAELERWHREITGDQPESIHLDIYHDRKP